MSLSEVLEMSVGKIMDGQATTEDHTILLPEHDEARIAGSTQAEREVLLGYLSRPDSHVSTIVWSVTYNATEHKQSDSVIVASESGQLYANYYHDISFIIKQSYGDAMSRRRQFDMPVDGTFADEISDTIGKMIVAHAKEVAASLDYNVFRYRYRTSNYAGLPLNLPSLPDDASLQTEPNRKQWARFVCASINSTEKILDEIRVIHANKLHDCPEQPEQPDIPDIALDLAACRAQVDSVSSRLVEALVDYVHSEIPDAEYMRIFDTSSENYVNHSTASISRLFENSEPLNDITNWLCQKYSEQFHASAIERIYLRYLYTILIRLSMRGGLVLEVYNEPTLDLLNERCRVLSGGKLGSRIVVEMCSETIKCLMQIANVHSTQNFSAYADRLLRRCSDCPDFVIALLCKSTWFNSAEMMEIWRAKTSSAESAARMWDYVHQRTLLRKLNANMTIHFDFSA